MGWLLPSLIAVITTSFVLALTFFYLFFRERHKSLLIIAVGWQLYCMRFVCMLLSLFYPGILFLLLNQLINIWSSWLLYTGCICWLEAKRKKILLAITLLISSWVCFSVFTGIPSIYYSIPVFLLMGYLFIELGICFLRYRHVYKLAIKVLGWTLVIWGIHKLDYPLLRPVVAFAPWGYLLSAIFQIITALAMVLIYFEKARHMLLESRTTLDSQKDFYENIIDSIETGIWVADRNDRIIYGNNGVTEISGLPKELLVGLSFKDDLTRYQLDDFKKYYYKARKELREIPYQTEVITERGAKAIMAGMLIPITKGGEFDGMICTLQDLTERIRLEQQLRNALEEREVLLREIHHRMKNNLSVVLGLIAFEGTRTNNQKLKTILDALSSKIFSIALIHSILYDSDSFTHINFREYLVELLNYLADYYDRDRKLVRLQYDLDMEELDIDTTKTVGLIINELVTNSLKYAFPEQGKNNRIIVKFNAKGDDIFLKVSDNGVGLREKRRKGRSGHSGLFLVKTLCSELNADFRTENNDGTVAIISFKKKPD